MNKKLRLVTYLFVIAALASLAATATEKKRTKARASDKEITSAANPVLWRSPGDIRSRNLFFGPGGEAHAPHTIFTFVKEDMNGTSPKFEVQDDNGVKWKVKQGAEARPETVASRLVWAVGYSANEDYFMPVLRVKNLSANLHRGQNLVGPGGTFQNVRLKRYLKDEKKVGDWHWRSNPFDDTRELNGLRVMMALINNWDVKDENNSIYDESTSDTSGRGRHLIYLVSDLGASFGSGGRGWTLARSKGDLKAYSRSRFIGKIRAESVDFNDPAKPPLVFFLNLPEFILKLQMGWVCNHIPRADVGWIGSLLAKLSPEQVRDAFRAAGYSSEEVEGFSEVVEARIAQLNQILSMQEFDTEAMEARENKRR
jgi:hypothetical protein